MSSELQSRAAILPPSSPEMVAKIQDVQSKLLAAEQIDLVTEHILHAGMYARTIRLQPGVILSGALLKIPTMLIVNGFAEVLVGDEWGVINGYGVICGSAGRKQVFITRSQVEMTMIFPTQAKTVEEAEEQFTDEAPLLMSRRSTTDIVVITGE